MAILAVNPEKVEEGVSRETIIQVLKNYLENIVKHFEGGEYDQEDLERLRDYRMVKNALSVMDRGDLEPALEFLEEELHESQHRMCDKDPFADPREEKQWQKIWEVHFDQLNDLLSHL